MEKARVILNKSLIDKAIKYYKYRFSEGTYERLNDWECFSDPSLELHDCNSRASLSGGRKCTSCDHEVDKACDITCDFQTFCLAAYAYRIGIGGEDIDKAFQRNLYKVTPDELFDEVITKLACDILPEETKVEEEPPTESKEEKEEMKKEREPKFSESGERLYTVAEAATAKGCKYINIYQNIKSGKIKCVVDQDEKVLIPESELTAFNLKTRAKRAKKDAE